MVALIPARAGSKRCPGKNTRLLAGHPLIAYTIAAAQQSGIFEATQVWSDDPAIHQWCAETQAVRSYMREPSADGEPDITWVRIALNGQQSDSFAILRPTSPFRTAATIRRAYERWRQTGAHSIRAVEPVKQHPGKMWQWTDDGQPMYPLIDQVWPARAPGMDSLFTNRWRPWHSQPTQTLPAVYVQNASLEMAHSWVIPAFGTISGDRIYPFFTEGYEGFDINTEADFAEAERIAAAHPELLPRIEVAA